MISLVTCLLQLLLKFSTTLMLCSDSKLYITLSGDFSSFSGSVPRYHITSNHLTFIPECSPDLHNNLSQKVPPRSNEGWSYNFWSTSSMSQKTAIQAGNISVIPSFDIRNTQILSKHVHNCTRFPENCSSWTEPSAYKSLPRKELCFINL